MEQKNNDRVEKMRGEMGNKLETISKEIKANNIALTVTNQRSETDEIKDPQPSGSRTNKSIGVRASNNENSDSENDDYLLRASKMKDLKHPKRIRHRYNTFQTNLSNEQSDVDDYHMVTGANQKLHRQSSQKLSDNRIPRSAQLVKLDSKTT